MKTVLVEQLSIYRVVIGYLGERDQFRWWQCSFFTEGSDSFLSPVFSKTQFLAQCNGVTQAASLLHDERIGIGNVYHLFRLPEDLEQSIHLALHDPDLERNIRIIIKDKDTALLYLNSSKSNIDFMSGPLHIGKISMLREPKVWQNVAPLYRQAFEKEQQTFPYYSDLRS